MRRWRQQGAIRRSQRVRCIQRCGICSKIVNGPVCRDELNSSLTSARRNPRLEFKESLQHLPIRRRCMQFPKREEKRRFWELVRAGATRTEAALAAGVVEQCGRRWFLQAGGVLPPRVPEVSSGRYLSMTEREEIFAGVERGDSIRGIADALGRAPSTVLRELRHNMRTQLYRTRSPVGHHRTDTWNYQ